ncbi:MAG: ParB N-terminal domain-containing protein, partial [Thermoplasmata archaeon]
RRLHGHEQIRPALLRELTEQIRRDGVLKSPVLVADRVFVILDGHHRVEALRALGCKRISVYLVDYYSGLVTLGTWSDETVAVVTKQDVIRRGLSNDLLPPKTTRHALATPVEDRPMDLELLK